VEILYRVTIVAGTACVMYEFAVLDLT